ncbi:MAG: endonuclease/exonuclease/phosphatase family protein [Sulfurimonas sp.]|uniref:endonuclease/exonuclease/phosphatase family protein n=1 Tax=Sulfurimonas sp. TaxID=2022749 RepID=UPI00260213AB|nr:endonuclease/exonuclease/phosphatase family protein [Sulfurimonas sp.]MCW8894497.1 endonuclease/exonuclease/phosphatase family protein [Sulfurimonas sp.]MCW8954114.1 endonuclease/exonuclease/phosphatase family protein [Sulfurimonas sp.]MCW9067758.1 endonuclease/exonuclease/phosphatase family protein [Sulfurimonas sp.]
MLKPSKSIKSLKHQDYNPGSKFTILCWNSAKLTLKNPYKELLKSLIVDENIDILLLQEVKKSLKTELDISDYSYILSPNIQTKRHVFGVLSAFKISCEDDFSLLTKKRELSYATHKVTLITKHNLSKDKQMLVVNLHAINFVKNSDFFNELNSIKTIIKLHKGPVIFAGDFNTWNVKRVNFLKEFTHDLSLKKVDFSEDKHVKKVFSNSLDYIFYRELKLTYSKVIDTKKISDHNPIIANFELL